MKWIVAAFVLILSALVLAQSVATRPASAPSDASLATQAATTSSAALALPAATTAATIQFAGATQPFAATQYTAATGPALPTSLPASGRSAAMIAALAKLATQPAASAPSSSSSYSDSRYRDRGSYDRRSSESRAPSNVPGYSFVAKPLDKEFFVLMTRSIFLHGNQAVYWNGDRGPGGNASLTRLPTNTTNPTTDPSAVPPMWVAENTLVFNGASDVNGELLAFIENTAMNTIARYHVGDAVASGKVSGMTLDQLDYAVGPKVTHVMIGQNLSGVDTLVLTTQPVGSSSGAAGGGTSSGGGAADDLAERMRRRRMQELGGK